MSVKQIALTLVILLSVSRLSSALPPFRKPLDERYAKTDDELRRDFRRVNCNLCHVENKEKRFVNAYGKLLADLIPGNVKDRLDTAASRGKKAREAEFKIVMCELGEAVKKADVLLDSAAVTYGDLFRSRRLPTGDKPYTLRDN